MDESLSILVSTLDDGIYQCKKILRVEVDEVIIVHQISDIEKKENYLQFHKEFDAVHCKVIPSYEIGLSKSRNICLQHATSDLLLICDDDGSYDKNLKNHIITYIQNLDDIDIFTFKIKSNQNLPFKKYPIKSYRHTIFSVAKVSSIEILIRKKWINYSKVRFDEHFGLGSKFPSGEEYIFLTDAVKMKAKIQYIPEYIVEHPPLSTGKLYTIPLIQSKGAMFKRTFKSLYICFNFLFAIKKYSEYKNSYSFLQFLKYIYLGSKYKLK